MLIQHSADENKSDIVYVGRGDVADMEKAGYLTVIVNFKYTRKDTMEQSRLYATP